MTLEFWRKVRKWAQRKEADRFLERHYRNLRCEHCNTWESAAGDCNIFEFGHPIACGYKCGKCGKNSAWVCEGGWWFRAKDFLGYEVDVDAAIAAKAESKQ